MVRPWKSRTAGVKLLLGAAFVALLIGGAATAVGVTGLVSDPDAVPTCDGKPMSADDRCDVQRAGSTVDSYTYAEKVEQQHRNKDNAGDTITIGLTVIAVSLLAGALVEFVSRRSDPRTRSTADTPGSPPPPPDSILPASTPQPTAAAPTSQTATAPVRPQPAAATSTPQASDTAPRRGLSATVIAGATGVVCAALVVAVILVVVNRGGPSGSSTAANASPTPTSLWRINGPDVAELRAAMPAAMRAATECHGWPGAHSPDDRFISWGTCKLTGESRAMVSGLAAVPSMAAYFESGLVYHPVDYRNVQLRGGHPFRDDGSVYAEFTPHEGGDTPGLGNELRVLDLRTGLFFTVPAINNEQDAATYLQRLGF